MPDEPVPRRMRMFGAVLGGVAGIAAALIATLGIGAAAAGTTSPTVSPAAATDTTTSASSDPTCTGASTAPATCVYHWVETYYDWATKVRHVRVCAIDGGCQWQSAHTSWTQVSGADYWINSTGQQLADGNGAEAYLCVGSAPANWTSYASDHDPDVLLARAETSTAPVPAGTCSS